jgi:hypothetical protein
VSFTDAVRQAGDATSAAATNAGAAPPQRPLLDRLWDTLTDPGVHEQLRSGKMSRADLDAAVAYYTNGSLKSFADLAATRTRMTNTAAQQEQARIATPSRGLSYAAGAANEMALGLPEKLAPLSGRNSFARQFTDILNRGREAYPRTEPVAELGGSIIPAALGGEGAAKLAEPAIGALSKVPVLGSSIGRMLARGAAAGAGGSAAAEYASDPNAAPDWKRIGSAAVAGAPFGAAAAVPAWWAATKLNPMEHVASRAVMESAPGDQPSMASGMRALTEGSTSPMPIGRPGPEEITFKAHPKVVNDALPEPLQQMNFEKSAKLRVEGAKFLAADPEAMNSARLALSSKLDRIGAAISKIGDDYDPILKGRALTDADLEQLPPGTQRAMRQTPDATARDLFHRYKSLRDKASAIFDSREAGTLTNSAQLDDAAAMSQEARALRDWLGTNVDGFEKLQQRIAPWLQRQGELQIARRQIVGRAIKPLGKATDVPSGGAEEGYKELAGYAPRLISSRAARRLAPVLLSPKLEDLFHAAQHPDLKEIVPDLIRSVPAMTGVGGPGARDLWQNLPSIPR